MASASKPRSDKKDHKTKAKRGSNTKHDAESQAKKGKGKSKAGLEEAISALGGSKDDLAMLKGVSADEELVQGEQEVDVRSLLCERVLRDHAINYFYATL